MNYKKLKETIFGLIELLRPFNCLIAGLAAYLGYCISLGNIQWNFQAIMLILVAFLVCGAGQAINDYFDAQIDVKSSKKARPIPSARVSAKQAILYSAGIFIIANALAFFYLPRIAYLISIFYSLLLIAYSVFLKRIKYLGNILVASATGITYFFGASIIGNYFLIWILALSAFFANWAREITKDVEDIQIDKLDKITLPMMIGNKASEFFGIVLYLIAIPLVVFPSFIPALISKGIFNPNYLTNQQLVMVENFASPAFIALISFSAALMIIAALNLYRRKYNISQKFAKFAMALAIISYFIALMI